jgi:two-component system response regulator ResD
LRIPDLYSRLETDEMGDAIVARILAVDDQPYVTRIIAGWLTRAGHEVLRADDGAAALKILHAEPIDILITDIDMPHLDGLSLLSHRAAVERLCGVIVLTGRSDYKELRWSHRGHTVHLLPKPFSPTRLAELVEQLLPREDSLSPAHR